MSSIIFDNIRINGAKNFLSELSKLTTYAFVARPNAWSGATPTPIGSYTEQSNLYESIISYKPLNPIYSSLVCPVYRWTSGVTYGMYSSELGSNTNPSSPYYVLNSTNDVYLCLYNHTSVANPNGIPSTDEPVGNSNSRYNGPNDGYIWKYLYTLSNSGIQYQLDSDYMPVNTETDLIVVDGEISCCYPLTLGSGMASNTQSVPYYYCRIVGDGEGAVLQFRIVDGFISDQAVVRTGQNYTYAVVDMVDGRIYDSLFDLDNDTNTLSIGGTKPTFRINLPPPGGFLYDIPTTLKAYTVSSIVEFKYGFDSVGGDAAFFTQSKFRQYGVIKDIRKQDGTIASGVNYSGLYSIKLSAITTSFVFGETISQGNARGMVVHMDEPRGVVFYIQSRELHTVDNRIVRFSGTDSITGSLGGSATPNTNYSGSVSTFQYINGYSIPQIKKNTGTMLYLNNLQQQIERSPTNIERVKFIINF